MKQQIAAVWQALIKLLRANNMPDTIAMTTHQKNLYNFAKICLDTHITLDSTVPPDLGCAESVSYVLNGALVSGLPSGGFPGTAALHQFLASSPDFVQITEPIESDIVISPTGTSLKNSLHGHTGIVMENGNIASNDSNTGLFRENYTTATWSKYFNGIEGFPVFYFRLIH